MTALRRAHTVPQHVATKTKESRKMIVILPLISYVIRAWRRRRAARPVTS